MKSPLTKLDLSDGVNLRELHCFNNQLTNLNFLDSLNSEKLTELDISNNNIISNLNPLKRFVNLETLYLENNPLYSSLKPLRGMVKLEELNIKDTNIDSGLEYLPDSIKEFKFSAKERKDAKCQAIYNLLANEQGWIETDDYGEIKNFPQKLQEYKWRKNFTEQEIQQWKEIGLTSNECGLANYLNQKGFTPQTAKNNLENLRTEYKSHVQINQFIQQKNLTKIPYEHLDNIEYLTQGGFGKIYQAEWEEKNVILKSLNNSQGLSPEFLREIASHELFADNTKIVKCYGISQNPETQEHVMVMDYVRGGNLRQYLQKNNKLDLKKKIIQLNSIVEGLKDIHEKGLVHKDFHLGNILSKGKESFFNDLPCLITDLGLCRPANETDQGNIYGVMPYVDPEVLQSNPYTQASDVYSFGIVAYELLANAYPYYEYFTDSILTLRICKEGLRPNLNKVKIPQLLKDLMKKCWDTDPQKRPSAKELYEIINGWYEEIENRKDTEFYQQYLKAKKEYNSLSQDTSYKIYPAAILTSQLINTKHITQQLQEYASKDLDLFVDETIEIDLEETNTETKTELSQTKENEFDKELIAQLEKENQELKNRIKDLEEQLKVEQQSQILQKDPVLPSSSKPK